MMERAEITKQAKALGWHPDEDCTCPEQRTVRPVIVGGDGFVIAPLMCRECRKRARTQPREGQ